MRKGKEKFVLQSAGAYEWETRGIFDSEESIHKWIKENWNAKFDDDDYESLNDWYEEMEINVIKTIEYIDE